MKRRLDCAVCGRALPAGCRIDKRYCDQRCIELAYYDRHPEKRAQKVANLRGTRAASEARTRRPDVAPELVQRVEAAHASTSQAISALSERMALLQAALPGRAPVSPPPSPPKREPPDAAATQQIDKLQATIKDERERADRATQEVLRQRKQIAALQEQQEATKQDLATAQEAAQQAVQRSKDQVAEIRRLQAQAPRIASGPTKREAELTTELQGARDRIAELEGMLRPLEQRVSKAEQARQAADEASQDLQRSVERWRAKFEAQARQLSTGQAALSRVAELEAALQAMTCRAEQAAAAQRTIEDKRHELQRELERTQRNLETQTRMRHEATDDHQRRVRDMESELSATRIRAEQAERTAQAAAETIDELQRDVQTERTRVGEKTHALQEAQRALQDAGQNTRTLALLDKLPTPWPWMRRLPDHPGRYVPRWQTLGAHKVEQLQVLSDVLLARVPEHLKKHYPPESAQALCGWLRRPSAALKPLLQQIVLRSVCTPRSLRSSDEQIEPLANTILIDSCRQLAMDEPTHSEALQDSMQRAFEIYIVLSRSLLQLCIGAGEDSD